MSSFSNALKPACGATAAILVATHSLLGSASAARAGTSDLWDTRISVLDECPVTGKEQLPTERTIMPILATAAVSLFEALLPKAVDVGLSYAASEAKKAAQADSSINEASGLGWIDGFYQLTQDGDRPLEVTSYLSDKCLVVARGLYASGDVPPAFTSRPWKDATVEERVTRLGLKRDPGIYLEARFRVSPDRTHFRIEPLRFYFDKPLHDGTQPNQEFDTSFEFKFQAPSGDNSGVTFAFGNLVLRSVTKGENLKEEALAVSSTGWMPILPQTAEISAVGSRVSALYTQRTALTVEIADAEGDIKRLAEAWAAEAAQGTGGDPKPIFEAVLAKAREDLAKDIYDDSYFTALLNSQPATASSSDGDAEAKAQRELERERQTLTRNRERQEVVLRRERAQLGLAKLAFLELKRQELKVVGSEIETLERERPVFAPVNVVVTIKEQISKPENRFLMTAAEVLEGSKEGVKATILSTVTPEGRERLRAEQLAALGAKADLVVAAMEARRLAQEREISLRALQPGASELEVVNARHALDTAKIQANIAALKAGLSPPFRDVFGATE